MVVKGSDASSTIEHLGSESNSVDSDATAFLIGESSCVASFKSSAVGDDVDSFFSVGFPVEEGMASRGEGVFEDGFEFLNHCFCGF